MKTYKEWLVFREDGLFISDHDDKYAAIRICYDYNKDNQPEYLDYVYIESKHREEFLKNINGGRKYY